MGQISVEAVKFNIAIQSATPVDGKVYRVRDIFTTRDGSWEPSGIPGSIPQWARDTYLRPWGAPDYFDDAGADHHLFGGIYDAVARRMVKPTAIRYWTWTDNGNHVIVPVKDKSGWANIVMFNSYNPDLDMNAGTGERGAWAWRPDTGSIPADTVLGGGMPFKWHVSMFATWELVTDVIVPPPPTIGTHRMGYHWIPAGNRSADHDYMRRLKARAGKVVSLNRDRIGEALSYLHPAGTLFLRDHPQSEQQADFAANPMETGRRHAREWIEKLTGGGSLAGLPLNRIAVCLLNEPTVHNAAEEERLVAYTREALLTLQPHGIRAMVYNLSSGWVRNADTATVKNTKPIWDVLRVLEPLINQTGSWMGLHEYFRTDPDEGWYTAPNGERWGWNTFRHWACPMSVKIIIGECGMSKRINGNPAPGQPTGWVGNVSPATYAEMLWRYERQCHPNVEAIMPFTTNYAADWEDKDTLGAHADILARIRPHTFPVPWPVHVAPIDEPPPVTDKFRLLWPKMPRISQYFGGTHSGLDIPMPVGTPLYAMWDGVVAWSDVDTAANGGYGEYVRVSYPELGFDSLSGHMSQRDVQNGDIVRRGQRIGTSGSTGNSTGPHLHLEIRLKLPNKAYRPGVSLFSRGQVDPMAVKWALANLYGFDEA